MLLVTQVVHSYWTQKTWSALSVQVIVINRMVSDVDVVLGLDANRQLGGVTVYKNVEFGIQRCAASVQPERSDNGNNNAASGETSVMVDKDFRADFDGKR